MDNTKYNAKCVKCGYIFEADESKDENECPLCKNVNNTKEAMDGFKEKFKDYIPEKKSKRRVVLDIFLFTGGLIAFILLLYFVITLITDLTAM